MGLGLNPKLLVALMAVGAPFASIHWTISAINEVNRNATSVAAMNALVITVISALISLSSVVQNGGFALKFLMSISFISSIIATIVAFLSITTHGNYKKIREADNALIKSGTLPEKDRSAELVHEYASELGDVHKKMERLYIASKRITYISILSSLMWIIYFLVIFLSN